MVEKAENTERAMEIDEKKEQGYYNKVYCLHIGLQQMSTIILPLLPKI